MRAAPPEKSLQQVAVALSPGSIKAVERLAHDDNRSVSAWMRIAIERAIKEAPQHAK